MDSDDQLQVDDRETVLKEQLKRLREEQQQLKEAVEELLDVCAEKEVEIPEPLKNRVLGRTSKYERLSNQSDVIRSLIDSRRESEENDVLAQFREALTVLHGELPPLDLRLKDFSYTVVNHFPNKLPKKKNKPGEDEETSSHNNAPHRAKQKIKNVGNANPVYKLGSFFLKCMRNGCRPLGTRREERLIMKNVNLHFKPGKSYLVLGSPGSGKSTLLKAIAQTLQTTKNQFQGGEVSINGIQNHGGDGLVWSNLCSYVDQIDRLHPWLTVWETCIFAWECRMAGTHRHPYHAETPEADRLIAEMDKERRAVSKILEAMGLTRVKDTFVGDQQNVRGVSGGEKKRVTVAEMYCISVPIVCMDEISTGLDAATTFDITRFLGSAAMTKNGIIITSLLQPPPETVANFDELILLGDGQVLYSGPIDDVVDHFFDLGYRIPVRMDLADWLVAVSTKDGWRYLKDADKEGVKTEDLVKMHMTTDQMREAFYASDRGKAILRYLETPAESESGSKFVKDLAAQRYRNSQLRSLKLLLSREVLLWWRDKYQIRAKLMQATIMAIITGTVYWQTSSAQTKISAIFQAMFYPSMGSMILVVKQFPNRAIFYKHQDANFFPTWTYVAGRSVASIPVAIIDGILYGTVVYFFVGLAHDDGASIANYILFMLTLIVLALTSGLFFSMFSSLVQDVSVAQACMSVTMVILLLFCGFTVQPDVIPNYWIWVYWLNYFAWSLRGLAVNEFQSGKYDEETEGTGQTRGEAILTQFGFTHNGEPFTFEWAWWGILFCVGMAVLSVIGSIVFLNRIRYSTGKSLVTEQGDDVVEEENADDQVAIPFTKVDLTFSNIRYTVTASTSKDKLQLLKGVDGIISAGSMTALMGSSGAGKTTLMDVLSLRKTSGEIEGEVRLNGHLQEENSFRRCTGYVEQFDTQSAQLTIRETCEFSAKLRLDENDPAVTTESVTRFIDNTLAMLELTNLQDLQVGDDDSGGLSFEQKKRLSIAVELCANPAIIFLDEPTSGLDARAASIVMRGLKRIADTGRAVVATIHQPSTAIFNSFNTLLLLKRGGEVVFHGELGEDSCKLIEYLERYPSTPRIQPGENPATWMLTVIGAGSAQSDAKPFDYAGSYAQSNLREQVLSRIGNICAGATEENRVSYPTKFATSRRTQSWAVMVRLSKTYRRSPSYNVVRQLVSFVVACLFGSVYATQRVPTNESDMNSRINSIFIGSVFIFVNAQNTVLRVFELERNMYYRHKAAGMYTSGALILGFTVSEIPYILLASSLFVVPFYFILGFSMEVGKFFIYWLFFLMGLTGFTFIGQMWMSLFRDAETAQGIAGLLVSCTIIFSGVLIRPNQIPPFWIFMYWLMPGHYIFEGLIMSQFHQDDTPIMASEGSSFYQWLDCDPVANATDSATPCQGTAEQWVAVSFEDWSYSNIWYAVVYLAGFIMLSRAVSYVALITLNFRST